MPWNNRSKLLAARPASGRCIKRPRRKRKAQNKHRRNAGLSPRKLAKLPFRFGIQIVRQIRPAEIALSHFQALPKLPAGNIEHARQQTLLDIYQRPPIAARLISNMSVSNSRSS